MVAGGPRQRGCRAGHALGRRAGRVSQCRLGIQVERFFKSWFFGTLFECPGFSTSCRTRTAGGHGGVKAILHCGPRGLVS